MDSSTALASLQAFRQQGYTCFTQAADALFNLADALLTSPDAHSVIELALSPFFERKWSSVYEALSDGRIDRARLQQLLVAFAPLPAEDERLLIAVDASSIFRPEAATSPDRVYLPVPHLCAATPPVLGGWHFSSVLLVPPLTAPASSWAYPLASRRIESTQTASAVAAEQLASLLPLLRTRLPSQQAPLLLADRLSTSAGFLTLLADLPLDYI